MKLNIFNNKPIHLYSDLEPGERIDKLFVDFVFPILEPKGFKYLKSKREFEKKNEFFDFHISWYGRKYNESNIRVEFDIFLNSFSPRYRKWKTDYYQLDKNWGNAIDGTRVDYIKGWDKEYYNLGWYDLVKYDNAKLMDKVKDNIENAAFRFFDNYTSFDSAIETLKEYPIKHFEKIIDFYMLQDKWQEAVDFFENNKQWHEEQEELEGKDPNSQYSLNRRKPFELRKKALSNWLQHHLGSSGRNHVT